MQLSGYCLITAAALCLALPGPGLAQDTTPPSTTSETIGSPETPSDTPEAGEAATDGPVGETPDSPVGEASDDAVPDTPADAVGEPLSPDADASSPATGGAGEPATDAPGEPATDVPGEPATDAADPTEAEPSEVTRATFDDWEVRCLSTSDECFLYQLALDPDGNPVAEFSLLKLPASGEAAAGATVVTPLGTLLTSGVVLQIDSDAKRQYPFGWCSQVGCFARFGLDNETIGSMKRGSSGELTLVSVADPDAPISVPLSLTGFTAAYDSLEIPN